jgi:hypothetical protein
MSKQTIKVTGAGAQVVNALSKSASPRGKTVATKQTRGRAL